MAIASRNFAIAIIFSIPTRTAEIAWSILYEFETSRRLLLLKDTWILKN
jgi:hypothetical protein